LERELFMNNKEYNKWIAFAQEDLKMAELALKEEIYDQNRFHILNTKPKIGFSILIL